MAERDLFDLAASAGAAAAALQVAQRNGVRRAAIHVTTDIRNEIRKVTGGDMRLSNVRKGGAPVGAGFDLRGTTNPTALIKGRGAIALVEHGSPPHEIDPKGRRGKRRRALKFGGRYAATAQHPGFRGMRPFAKGVAKAGPDTPKIFQREIRDAIQKAWF